ncbi:LytR/AlgR family response regulator transcription factor [Brevibacillus massiliensis]|uniref:LytR/AlgR family response regulator transcription factor n=1 Tax=Brevibacillus massiliensis TaxID=1118054 RepID=UPI0003075E48|nr:LytTR family DNA-binding domain-containing protein [Brevibacillus massiliensis]
MLPIKIVIADDEPGILLLLRSILSELPDALIVGTAENANDALRLVREKGPELTFLDIELPDRKGLELAENLRKIKPDMFIVFITAHRKYSLEAFHLYACDYILKPIDPDRVKQTFRYVQQILKLPAKHQPASHLQTPRISINLGHERIFVKLSEIFYIEKTGRHTFISCVNGKFKTRQTLQELEQNLGTGFFRSHKSYIINTEQVERIVHYPNSSYYEVRFKNYNGKALLSRDRVHELMAYAQYNV